MDKSKVDKVIALVEAARAKEAELIGAAPRAPLEARLRFSLINGLSSGLVGVGRWATPWDAVCVAFIVVATARPGDVTAQAIGKLPTQTEGQLFMSSIVWLTRAYTYCTEHPEVKWPHRYAREGLRWLMDNATEDVLDDAIASFKWRPDPCGYTPSVS